MPDQPQQTEDSREKQNRLLERLGTALLGLKSAIEGMRADNAKQHADQLAQGNAHLTQQALVAEAVKSVAGLLAKLDQLPVIQAAIAQVSRDVDRAVGEARKDLERTDRSLDGLREDLTPVHGTKLPSKAELDEADERAKVKLGPVSMREKLLLKLAVGVPWMLVGLAISLLAVIYMLARQGEGVGVVPLKVHPEPTLSVPQLAKPHEP